ncbi:colanic acid biosynthesis pyruvyl transferase WcaK, partial [Enterobacter kobei]|nr:colanic acid biosynthesis pyruvyl transferase WcaK [Enterobacter kobei]
ELNDLKRGKLLAAGALTRATRLHSAIISMNFGTPAIAINYEHKSAGIMQQLGMPEMAVDIRHLLDGSLGAMVGDTLGQLPAINERLAVAVKAEREKGIGMVKSVLDRVREGK